MIFLRNVFERQVDVTHRHLDAGVPHQFLDDRQRDLFPNEVGREGVTEEMGPASAKLSCSSLAIFL